MQIFASEKGLKPGDELTVRNPPSLTYKLLLVPCLAFFCFLSLPLISVIFFLTMGSTEVL